MKINKAYKFRLYPNRKQEELINKTIGSSRFIYNYILRRKTNEEIVKKIIESHDIIVSENLQVNKMIEKENKSLRKLIINSTMSDIIRRIKYKCDWENKEYYQVDRYYASSQICSRCGKIKKDMKDINKREYECDNCGLKMDRDLNASINIMTEGLFKEYRYE